MKYESHQFRLFSFSEVRPTGKVPISKERIEQARQLMYSEPLKAAAMLREVRERLERYEQRINGTKTKNPEASGD